MLLFKFKLFLFLPNYNLQLEKVMVHIFNYFNSGKKSVSYLKKKYYVENVDTSIPLLIYRAYFFIFTFNVKGYEWGL